MQLRKRIISSISSPISRNDLFLCGLFGAIFLSFSPLFSAQYINWDDMGHMVANPLVSDHSLSAWVKIFLAPNSTSQVFVPLTILSFNLEQWAFGYAPVLAHIINLVLHFAITVLVFRLSTALGLSSWASFVGALLFAVHPMHVESVAWLTCRKDVLYGLFYVLSLLFYVDYIKSGRFKVYILALIFSILSILSKPMALSLPLVLFLIDWILGRKFCWKSIVDKMPFFLVIVPIAVITSVQNVRSLQMLFPGSIFACVWSASFYIEKFFLPFGLAPLYAPPVPINLHWLSYIKSFSIFMFVSLLALRFRMCKWFIFGLLFYVLSTFFLWRYDARDASIVADRFMYIPSIGFCLFIGWGVSELWKKLEGSLQKVFGISVVFVFLLFSSMTFQQASSWKNCWTFWTKVLEMNPGRTLALYSRAWCSETSVLGLECGEDLISYVAGKRLSRGSKQYLAIKQRLSYFRFLLARRDLVLAVRQEPTSNMFSRMGQIYLEVGSPQKALVFFKKGIRVNPLAGYCYYKSGQAEMALYDYPAAIRDFTRAIDFAQGRSPDLYKARALAYMKSGNKRAALEDFALVLKFSPKDPEALRAIKGLREE